MANVDEQAEYKTQYWFCGVCKVTEECSVYVTMIYHKHDSSLVILQPLTRQAYVELKTVVTKVKKVRKRDAVRASKQVTTPMIDIPSTETELSCICTYDNSHNIIINPMCHYHGYQETQT